MKTSSSDTFTVPAFVVSKVSHPDVLQTPKCRFSLIEDIPPSNRIEVTEGFQTPNQLSNDIFNSSLNLNAIDHSLIFDTFLNHNNASFRLQPRKRRFQNPNELVYDAFNSSLTLNTIDHSLTLDTFLNQNHDSYRLQPRKRRRFPILHV